MRGCKGGADEEAKDVECGKVGNSRAGAACAVARTTEEQARRVPGTGMAQSLSVPQRSLPSGCRGPKGQVRWERVA